MLADKEYRITQSENKLTKKRGKEPSSESIQKTNK